jgi:hypothetical protein
MADESHRSPPLVPMASYSARLERARKRRRRLDRMLEAYWAILLADSEPLAEAQLERALKGVAVGGTLFV